VSFNDAIDAAHREAGRQHAAQLALEQAERRAQTEATSLATEAVARMADFGNEVFVRVEKARLFQPIQYLDYLGTRYKTASTMRCWIVFATREPSTDGRAIEATVLLLADGTIGRFRPPVVPLQRTRCGRRGTAEFVSTDDLATVRDSTDPFIRPHGSYLEADRHRLAAAIVRYERQQQSWAVRRGQL
jgi:hypothetical protein